MVVVLRWCPSSTKSSTVCFSDQDCFTLDSWKVLLKRSPVYLIPSSSIIFLIAVKKGNCLQHVPSSHGAHLLH